MPKPELEFRQVPFDHPDAARLVEQVQLEYVELYGGRDETPLDPSYFAPPLGAFYVGYLQGVPLVTGAWRRRTDVQAFGRGQAAEIKRMYVLREARRAGVARRMLAHLEQTARAAGADLMVLETGNRQPEAIALYTSSGYVPIADFGHYAGSPEVRSYGKPLSAVRR